MTVETTIQWMFDNYPDLFATRKECYNHLFCVIGNGYEWKRGQIVRCDEYDKPIMQALALPRWQCNPKRTSRSMMRKWKSCAGPA